MHRKLFPVSTAIVFLLASCTPATATIPVAALPAMETVSPISTSMSLPTKTLTPSITPLPTIPSFTPTLDISTIITVTPAPQAECPDIDPAIKPEDYLPTKLEYPSPNTAEKILEFLNEGGDGRALIARLKQIYPAGGDYRGGYDFADVTGDQISELLYIEIYYEGRLLIFSCKQGKYELLATLPEENDFLEYTMQVVNLNTNGIPEIIVMGTNGVSYPISTIFIYKWTGQTFSSLGHLVFLALRQTKIIDMDGDGTKEIAFSGDNPTCTSCSNFIPQREKTMVFGWNGESFVPVSNVFTPPVYRFQAVQDADAAVSLGKYEEALEIYSAVIKNQNLGWWSRERFTYEQTIGDPIIMFIETPSYVPTEDFTEYPRLAAYAYYRTMLIHFAEGNEQEANVVYSNLQESLGNNEAAQPYIEMATRFINAYQATQEIYDGCAAVIQYAAEHREILIPLGSDYHGWQSHTYTPADICPLR